MDDVQKKCFFDKIHQELMEAIMALHAVIDCYPDNPQKDYTKQKIDEAYLWGTQLLQQRLMAEVEKVAREQIEKALDD